MKDNKEELFLNTIEEETRVGVRTLACLAMILFPVFNILDYLTQYQSYGILSLIRFTTTFFFLCSWLIFRKDVGLKRPFISALVVLGVAAGSITLMCMVLEGAAARYYAGVNLVMLAGVLILTVSPQKMLIFVLMIIGIYVTGVVSADKEFQAHSSIFINNLFFLISTGIVGVTASHLKYKFRRKSFEQTLEISQSIDLLNSEVEKKTEVQNALQIRDSFISMASHELRTPLTSMKLQMDLAKIKLAQPTYSAEDVLKHVLNAYRQITNINHLVDEMLDVSRIQSGKFVLDKEEFDLNELVRGILERSYSEAAYKGKIVTYFYEETLIGQWDPFKIEQVIINLINNAFRYGGEEVVIVTTEKAGNKAFVTVTDKGPGISASEQIRIFEKFERGKKMKGEGLGLGLYISRQIALNHGGALTVDSDVGRGSSFILQLPL